MGVITTLGIAGLAGVGLATMLNRLPKRRDTSIGLTVAILIGLETLSIPTRMTAVETPADVPPVYRWLATQTDNAPALELPTIESRWLDRPLDLERQGHEQYLSIFHWHPTPSGYSGFEPPLFWSVIREAKDFPTDESVNFLQCVGVKYVVFHQNQYPPDRWRQIQSRIAESTDVLRPLQRFGDDSVYELAPAVAVGSVTLPTINLPSEVVAGTDYRGFLVWSNPGPAAAPVGASLVHIHASWLGGTATPPSDVAVAAPGCLARGWNTVLFDVPSPNQPGRYQLSIDANGGTTQTTVTVTAPPFGPISNVPQPAMQAVDVPSVTSRVEPGGVAFAQIDWRLRHRTQDNYLLRLEIVDGRGQVVGSSTTDPFDGALETGRWLADEQVAVGLSAIVPRSVAPGMYTARVKVLYADGAQWKLAGPDGNDRDSIDIGTITVT
jgi:hypothetical protein